MPEADIKSPRQLLMDYEEKLINAIHASLEKHDRVARGQLWQSVKAETKIYGQAIVLEVSMLDYWKYVEDGRRKGVTAPPQDAMLTFIRDRGIKVTLSNRRKKNIKALKSKRIKKAYKQYSLEQKRKSLAFVLAQSIKKKGIKPTHFLAEVVEGSIVSQLEKDLRESVGRDIKVAIIQAIEQ